jgi:hypothetical protein
VDAESSFAPQRKSNVCGSDSALRIAISFLERWLREPPVDPAEACLATGTGALSSCTDLDEALGAGVDSAISLQICLEFRSLLSELRRPILPSLKWGKPWAPEAF